MLDIFVLWLVLVGGAALLVVFAGITLGSSVGGLIGRRRGWRQAAEFGALLGGALGLVAGLSLIYVAWGRIYSSG